MGDFKTKKKKITEKLNTFTFIFEVGDQAKSNPRWRLLVKKFGKCRLKCVPVRSRKSVRCTLRPGKTGTLLKNVMRNVHNV